MKKVVCQSTNQNATISFGQCLGSRLNHGGVILLQGDLGAGKTSFVQGMAQGLGIKQRVSSPTFIILAIYPIPHHAQLHQLAHLDLYRLGKPADIATLDLKTLLVDPATVLVVEWPEKLPGGWTNVLGTIVFAEGKRPGDRSLSATGLVASLLEGCHG